MQKEEKKNTVFSIQAVDMSLTSCFIALANVILENGQGDQLQTLHMITQQVRDKQCGL